LLAMATPIAVNSGADQRVTVTGISPVQGTRAGVKAKMQGKSSAPSRECCGSARGPTRAGRP
jgi:hypothetical protein